MSKLNNLKGWLRDAKQARIDDTEEWKELVELIDDILHDLEYAATEADDLENYDADTADIGDPDEVDSGDAAVRQPLLPGVDRPTPGGVAHSNTSRGLGGPLDDVARALGVSPSALESQLRLHRLGPTSRRVGANRGTQS